MRIYPVRGLYNLSTTAMATEKVTWPGIQLDEGERRALNLTLKKAISIEGTLLMLDDKTPHVAVVVQAVTPASLGKNEPTVVATTLSDESGKYRFINLKPGRYRVQCRVPGGYVYYGGKFISSSEKRNRGKILQIELGKNCIGQ